MSSLTSITIRVPATTANLGPGFDCLGLALDLWNEVKIERFGSGIAVEVTGEGADQLPTDESNLIAESIFYFFKTVGARAPEDLHIRCRNDIPLSSGLGSSSAAVLSGLLGANELLGGPRSTEQILRLAAQLEGHPDNVAPAIMGGLTVVATAGNEIFTAEIETAPLPVTVVVPAVKLSTQDARRAIPDKVRISDAVFNVSRTALVVESLRTGDLELLRRVMDDRLHQPYRTKLIPGAADAIRAAQEAGAAAALSGAGPGVVAFSAQGAGGVGSVMVNAFAAAGVQARVFELTIARRGANVRRRNHGVI